MTKRPNDKNALIMFTRVPVPGKTKTRMMPFLSPEQCADMHECFLRDIYGECLGAGADLFVFYALEGDPAELHGIFGEPEEAEFVAQRGKDLAERMANAFSDVFSKGYRAAILIGTDIPEISVSLFGEIFDRLKGDTETADGSAETTDGTCACDAVICRTDDGGYGALGLSASANGVLKKFSEGKYYDAEELFAFLEEEGLSPEYGRVLTDIDTEDDLARLGRRLFGERSRDIEAPEENTKVFIKSVFPKPAMDLSHRCISCGTCTKNCDFLSKYGIDLSGFEARPELAYSCFMCGKCKAVCPKDIDGAEIALIARLRNTGTPEGGRDIRKKFKTLIFEKENYKFSNMKTAGERCVFFPGCNFAGMYPASMKKLEAIAAAHDIGVVYECCRKPIYEIGLADEALDGIKSIEEKLLSSGAREIVTCCANCYYFMRDKIDLKVTDIYSKLAELGEGHMLEGAGFDFFYPCPDREEKIFMDGISKFLPCEPENGFPDIQCCGLGGCASGAEPEISHGFSEKAAAKETAMYSYCASCTYMFRKNGFSDVKHVLPEILGIREDPKAGVSSLISRSIRKFK